MSRIRCSQCGQEGHNRRNRRCPVNVQRVDNAQVVNPTPLISPETRERMRRCNDKLAIAVNLLEDLTQHISRPESSARFVLGVFIIGNDFRDKINKALELDRFDIKIIDPVPLFERFSTQINIFNAFVTTLVSSSFQLVSAFQDGKFELSLHNPNGISLDAISSTPIIKRTSAYFKEIALIQDIITINDDAPACDCPLCFDAVPATDCIVTNCKHSFCVTCVKGFATANKDKTKKPVCPMCRTDLTEFKVGNQQVHNEISEHILNL
jgi:hypothetical protein